MCSVFSLKELWLIIINDLSPGDINALSSADRSFCEMIEKIGYELMQFSAFGAGFYSRKFKYEVKQPELPKNIYRIYNSIYRYSLECGINKKPILYLIDPRLTLEKTGRLVQPYFESKKLRVNERQEGYRTFDPVLHNRCEKGYTPHPKYENPRFEAYYGSYWGILINGSMLKSTFRNDQKQIVEKIRIDGKSFRLPNVEEAALGVFLHWVAFKECEFDSRNRMRTSDEVLTVGRHVVTIEGIDRDEGMNIKPEIFRGKSISDGVSPFFTFDPI